MNGQMIETGDFNMNLLSKNQITEKHSENLKHRDIIQHIEKPTRPEKKLISLDLTKAT